MGVNLFSFSQMGLLAAALCSIGIIHYQATSPTRPPGYYSVCVWAVAIGCAFAFANPYVNPADPPLPDAAYILRILFGIERAAVLFYYRTRRGGQWSTALTRGVNTYVVGMSVAGILAFSGYSFWRSQKTIEAKTDRLEAEIKTVAKRGVIKNTLAVGQLQRKADSLEQLHRVDQANINWLTHQLGLANQHLNILTRQVELLQGSVWRLSQKVDRSGRQLPTPPPIRPAAPVMRVDPKRFPTQY